MAVLERHIFDEEDVVALAHSVVTFDRKLLINHGNGYLVDRSRGTQLQVAIIYPRIRKVFDSRHQVIACRARKATRLLS